ncbi:MAG TPA: hypothetical protein VIF84_01405 [Candidatus Limnocylindrales bacterium]|jgi:hypothetical protein
MTIESAAKFFVNHGLVSSRSDIHNLLRPLLKQTVAYRYYRAGGLTGHGTGWVERIVVDEPGTSSFFTPLSICLNVDSFEHLEFETRPDQLLVYTLVQGDERIVMEFAPTHPPVDGDGPVQQVLRFAPDADYVQMELGGLDQMIESSGSDAPEEPTAS